MGEQTIKNSQLNWQRDNHKKFYSPELSSLSPIFNLERMKAHCLSTISIS